MTSYDNWKATTPFDELTEYEVQLNLYWFDDDENVIRMEEKFLPIMAYDKEQAEDVETLMEILDETSTYIPAFDDYEIVEVCKL